MSDFIPPLIPSSPPPMPDFEDDDDDEFGMVVGYNVGDLELPGTASDNRLDDEKQGKMIDIDERKLEINGTAVTNNWKCEEQDSTSQDSGLCMASHSSEGMSPLPQSDDEDKQNDVSSPNMPHSATVMFNPDQINGVNEFSENENSRGESSVLVNDTGQECNLESKSISSSLPLYVNDSCEINSSCTNHHNDNESVPSCSISDSVDNTVRSLEINDTNSINKNNIVNNAKEENGVDDFEFPCNNVEDSGDQFDESINSESNCRESLESSSTSAPEISGLVRDESFKATDSITFDSQINSINQSTCFDNVHQNNIENFKGIDDNDDEFDDDEFGNFACVTIPNDCDSNHINGISDKSYTDSNYISTCNSVIPNTNDVEGCSDSVSFCDKETESKGDFEDKSVERKTSTSSHELVTELSSNIDEVSKNNSVVVVAEKSDDKFQVDEEDDFDDFSDFTQSANVLPVELPQTYHQPSTSLSQEDTLELVFPKSDDTDFSENCIQQLECGLVWKHLCPLENSPALTFQWSNSRAHNRLLAALSIDSRNILFGPNWNANIPRFAANLGSNPLQPVKAAEGSSSALSSQHTSDDVAVVPDAHFDWVGSGLTNPLDCTPGKAPSEGIEQLKMPKHSIVLENVKALSVEAESIILLLPDLNFMRKTYIEFLINKD